MLRSRAARARAWAWFPELCVTTPRAATSAGNLATALQAPRNLNAPTFWKFSHLKKSERFAKSSIVAQVITGVRCARPARRSTAARTLSRSAAYVVMGSLYCPAAANSRGLILLPPRRNQPPESLPSGVAVARMLPLPRMQELKRFLWQVADHLRLGRREPTCGSWCRLKSHSPTFPEFHAVDACTAYGAVCDAHRVVRSLWSAAVGAWMLESRGGSDAC